MKFNKNEFGWKEKVSVNTDELVTKNDLPHYRETLKFEISGDDFSSFMDNSYFNMNALNLDETKSYIGKSKDSQNDNIEYIFKYIYNKEADALIDENSQTYIYNHKSYDGANFVEDTNSAVITFGITTFVEQTKNDRYFRLYEIDKVELDNNCLPKDVNIPNSLTVGTCIGDIGIYSVAEGNEVIASGDYSHAEGDSTIASGIVSHAEGGATISSGECSHAEGDSTIASGTDSHAEGYGTTSSGTASHAEGGGTTASGTDSHAEGYGNTASGDYSHAEGENTTASGYNAHAEGYYTKAKGVYQHVQGKYNIEDTANTYAHIVGNGTADNARSNAHTLDWQGNGWYQGKLSQDGTPTEDKDLVTKKYVDDTIANQPQISFDTEGNLVVTIGGVTKKFKEITE